MLTLSASFKIIPFLFTSLVSQHVHLLLNLGQDFSVAVQQVLLVTNLDR